MDHFFGSSSNLREQCDLLCKLHNVLELAASALTFLKLPTTTLSSLTKVALEVYSKETFEGFATTPIFCLPIPAYSPALKFVTSLCAKLSPKTWVLSSCSNTAGEGRHTGMSVTVMQNVPLFQTITPLPADTDSDAVFFVFKGHSDSILL